MFMDSKSKRTLLIIMQLFCTKILFAETKIPIAINKNDRYYKTITSWSQLRDSLVIKQEYDFSCGSSALATLINLKYYQNLSEESIIDLIIKDKNQDQINDISINGYSLLELKHAAINLGYNASIYKISFNKATQLNEPVIIYYEPYGEKHFAVLKKIFNKKIYIADPARGNIRISFFKFKQEWKGTIMIIDK